MKGEGKQVIRSLLLTCAPRSKVEKKACTLVMVCVIDSICSPPSSSRRRTTATSPDCVVYGATDQTHPASDVAHALMRTPSFYFSLSFPRSQVVDHGNESLLSTCRAVDPWSLTNTF